MNKNLYSLLLVLMLGIANCHAQQAEAYLQDVKIDQDYEDLESERLASYREWVAFEEWLEDDASPEVKALVKDIEKDLLMIFQTASIMMRRVIENNTELIVDHCKESAKPMFVVAEDMGAMIGEIKRVSDDFIFIDVERDAMQQEDIEKLVAYIQHTLDQFGVLLDFVSGTCEVSEYQSKALLDLDELRKHEAYVRCREKFTQLSGLSQQVFVVSLGEFIRAMPEIKERFYSILNTSSLLVDMTDCTPNQYVLFLDARMESIVDIYNKLALQFMSKHALTFEDKMVEELSQEEAGMILAIYNDLAQCCIDQAQQLLRTME